MDTRCFSGHFKRYSGRQSAAIGQWLLSEAIPAALSLNLGETF